MEFLSSAAAAVLRGLAQAILPPPPPDITRWCEENIKFDERSPFPGSFRIDRFPFLRRIHDVLSPEHPRGCVIDHRHKVAMVAAGRWVASNPAGDHPGFHLWRAYVPQRDWARIAVEYAQVMGRTGLTLSEAAMRCTVDAQTEQTFWNDVIGLPYEQASKGPDWEKLRDRVENDESKHGRPIRRGTVPAAGIILAAGVDCQLDRIEVQIVAFDRNYRRWVIDNQVIPHHIGSEEARSALNQFLKGSWRTEAGRRNEALDTMIMAEAGARYKQWTYMSDAAWDQLDAERGSPAEEGQGDLFTAAIPVVTEEERAVSTPTASAPPVSGQIALRPAPTPKQDDGPASVPERSSWI